MKHKAIKITTLITVAIFATASGVFAQTLSNYYLMPSSEIILPIGSNTNFEIYHNEGMDFPKLGTSTQYRNAAPLWTLNGQPSNSPANAEGRLAADLTFDKASYYAPDKVPKINPVTVAVKFKANDSTKEEVTLVCNVKIIDPGQNWYFAYIGTKSSRETIKSTFRDFIKTTKVIGSASMLIDATPPEKNGYVLVNTEQGDKVINAKVNGIYNFHQDDIQKAPNGNTEERVLRNYAGTPVRGQGVLFEYDPSLKGFKGGLQGAGISFDVTGTDEFWKPDTYANKLKKTINKVDEKYYDGISLGSNEDNIKKIKHGFSIEFSQSKDTSYTDIENAKHTIITKLQYHAVLLWVNKE